MKETSKNAIWWAINDKNSPSPLFTLIDSEKSDDNDQYLGNCNIFLYY
jgi:hypothetical protein